MRDFQCIHRSQLLQAQMWLSVELWGMQISTVGPDPSPWGKWARSQIKVKNQLNFPLTCEGKTGFCLSSLIGFGIFCKLFHHPNVPVSSSQEYSMGGTITERQFKWKVFLALDDQISSLWITFSDPLTHRRQGSPLSCCWNLIHCGAHLPILQPTQNAISGWMREQTLLRWDTETVTPANHSFKAEARAKISLDSSLTPARAEPRFPGPFPDWVTDWMRPETRAGRIQGKDKDENEGKQDTFRDLFSH